MQVEAVRTKGFLMAHWQMWAALVWALSLVIVSARVALLPGARSVYPAYVEGGLTWREGQDLYLVLGGYRYCPPVTVAFAALSHVPNGLAEVLWRLLGAGIFLCALAWWARAGLPRTLSGGEHGLLFLLVVPLALSSLNNGQVNLLLAGLLVAAVTAAARERWNLVTACLVVAILFKVYPVAIALLLLAVYPRQLGWRLPLGLAAGVALPYLVADPAYVSRQYENWLGNLAHDDRTDWIFRNSYRDLWLLLRQWGAPLSQGGYEVVQLIGAAGVALVCLAGRWAGWPPRRLGTTLLALGCCWMMLLGPATESSTYTLLAPSLAWAVLEAWAGRSWLARAAAAVSYGLFLIAGMASWFPLAGEVHGLGVHPLGALILFGLVLGGALASLRWTRTAGDRTSMPPAARAA
jgi:hypothetical protein